MTARTIALALTLLAFGGAAHAADGDDTAAPGAPIHPSERSGMTVGLSGGVADLHTFPKNGDEILQPGNGVAFDIGRAISQKLLVVGRAELVDVGDSTSHANYGLSIEPYLTQRLWIRGGIGVANYKAKFTDPTSGTSTKIDRWSVGATAGAGVEWLQFRKVALDAQLDWMGAAYPNKQKGDLSALNVSMMVGLRWYGL